jgi:hypothetical protein
MGAGVVMQSITLKTPSMSSIKRDVKKKVPPRPEEHDQWMLFVRADPGWASLRSEPRFQALLRRMNFPP